MMFKPQSVPVSLLELAAIVFLTFACIGPVAVTAQTVSPDDELGRPNVALVHSKRYDINLGGLERAHPFDIHKYGKIRRQLIADGLASDGDFFVPDELTKEQILLVHTPEFIESLKSSASISAYLEAPVTRLLPAAMLDGGLLSAFRHASGGTILACRLALEHGIAINLGGGYHHAKPNKGEGFCIYADMPIAIRILKNERLVRRVLVVDLDVHQGNGTIVCCQDDDTVFTFSMHQGNIYPVPKETGDLDVELKSGTGDEKYLDILRQHLPGVIDRAACDLVILQAGCDPLAGDPLAGLSMTRDGIVERDSYVIDTCVARGIPVVMTLGGGYSQQAWNVQHASLTKILKTHGLARRRPSPPEKPKAE